MLIWWNLLLWIPSPNIYKLSSRAHNFDFILTEPSEGSKDVILKFLTKEKNKKEKLKQIVLASFKQSHKIIEEAWKK